MPRTNAWRVVALLAGCTTGLGAMAEELRFIACPIYRDVPDSGRKGGCWLAEDGASGVRYDVSMSPVKPDWNHEVLVEGMVAATQDNACGGTVLDAVRVSILPGVCTRHSLPAEGYPARKFTLPARNTRPLSEKRVPPPPPWANRSFHLQYEWNRSFGVYQLDDYYLDQAIWYIRAVDPREVVVRGYAATTPSTVSGRVIAERDDVARERAEKVAESLRRLGTPPGVIKVEWHDAASAAAIDAADGLVEPSRRRVEIQVVVR
ncbi:MAG: hypothetical protein RLZZ393_2309 [Pseudomonadota bacterium]